MVASKLRFFALGAILSASLMACVDATGPCEQAGYHGAQLAACKVGAEQIGPHEADLATADRKCAERYDIRTVDPNDEHAFDNASQIADLFNACHNGAKGHFYFERGVPADALDGGVGDSGVPAGVGGAPGSGSGSEGCEQVTIGGVTRCQ